MSRGRTEHRVDQIAVPVNGAIQIAPLALNFHVGFIDIPAPAHFPLPLATDVLSQQRSETLLPLPCGFMRELESTQQKHLGQIPQAQLIQQPAEHDLEDDVGGKLEMVERSARSLIELSPAVGTPKYNVAEIRGAVQVADSGRLAMRTDHELATQNTELADAHSDGRES